MMGPGGTGQRQSVQTVLSLMLLCAAGWSERLAEERSMPSCLAGVDSEHSFSGRGALSLPSQEVVQSQGTAIRICLSREPQQGRSSWGQQGHQRVNHQ